MTANGARSWAPTIGGALLGWALLASGVAAAQEQDLSGNWIIDFAASDEPAEVFEGLSQRRSGRSGVGVGIGIFGVPVEVGRSGGRGSEPAEVVRRDLRRLRPHLSNNVDALDIEQSPERLRIDYGDIGSVDYREGEVVEQGEETAHAQWRRDVFTILRHVGDDLQATEEIYLDRSDPNRLHWLVSIELSSGRTVQIRRVYDREPPP